MRASAAQQHRDSRSGVCRTRPPYKVVTIELGSTGNAKRAYSQIHRACAAKVAEDKKVEGGEGGEPGRPPRAAAGVVTEAQRRLCYAALNPELDKFCTKVKKAHFKMVQMYSKYDDHGATYYHSVTRGVPHKPPYRERVDMALCITGLSLKL